MGSKEAHSAHRRVEWHVMSHLAATDPSQTVRHTPEPARVVYSTASFLLLGSLTALLGVLLPLWFLSLSIDTVAAGECFLAFNLGILAGTIGWARGLVNREAGVRNFLVSSALLAAAALVGLGAATHPIWLLPPLFALGTAVGALATGASWLVSGALLQGRAPEVLNLAGVAFGAGTIGVCILAWALNGRFHWSVTVRLLAIVPFVLAWSVYRAKVFRYMTLSAAPVRLTWRTTASPMAILLALALFLQSANQWAIGGWLALYLPRKFGMTASLSIMVLAVFWLGLTCGRVWGTRLPPAEERMRSLFWATLAAVVGCLFLLKTVEASGTFAGALLLGMAIGLIHPLTLGLVGSRYPYYHPGLLNGFFSLSLMGGLLGPWLIAQLAEPLGIEIIIWLTLGSSVLVYLLLAAIFVESRLTAHSQRPA